MMCVDLERALKSFNKDLLDWLAAGGDDRLCEFDPLVSWQRVIAILAAQKRGERAQQ